MWGGASIACLPSYEGLCLVFSVILPFWSSLVLQSVSPTASRFTCLLSILALRPSPSDQPKPFPTLDWDFNTCSGNLGLDTVRAQGPPDSTMMLLPFLFLALEGLAVCHLHSGCSRGALDTVQRVLSRIENSGASNGCCPLFKPFALPTCFNLPLQRLKTKLFKTQWLLVF